MDLVHCKRTQMKRKDVVFLFQAITWKSIYHCRETRSRTAALESEEVKNECNASLASPRPSDGSFAHPGHPYLHLRQMTRTFDTCNCKFCIVQLVCGSYEPSLQSSYHSICNAKLSNKSFAFLERFWNRACFPKIEPPKKGFPTFHSRWISP